MRRLLFIPLAIFLLLALVFVVQLYRNSQGDDPTTLESVLVGKSVPDFTLSALAKPEQQFDQTLLKQHKPVLLNVWATWCPTCYAEHSYLKELAAQGVTIVGINYKDDRGKALDWLKELGSPYTQVLFDNSGMVGLDLGVSGAPETFLIDGDGIIRYRHTGDLNPTVWQEKLLPLWQKYQEVKP